MRCGRHTFTCQILIQQSWCIPDANGPLHVNLSDQRALHSAASTLGIYSGKLSAPITKLPRERQCHRADEVVATVARSWVSGVFLRSRMRPWWMHPNSGWMRLQRMTAKCKIALQLHRNLSHILTPCRMALCTVIDEPARVQFVAECGHSSITQK